MFGDLLKTVMLDKEIERSYTTFLVFVCLGTGTVHLSEQEEKFHYNYDFLSVQSHPVPFPYFVDIGENQETLNPIITNQNKN